MMFARPEMLAWLWLIPAAIVLLWSGERRRRRRLALVAGSRTQTSGVQLRPRRTWLKGGLWLAALASLVVALAQPRWGFAWTDVKRHGSDIVVAVDVSNSMLAQDINPSRLERAKHEIIDLLGLLKGDRVGLVAFAGDAFVECPLTEDYAAMRMFVNYLAPDLIPLQGTDLGGAIETSMKALFDGSPDGTEGRAIILITDGEDQEPNAEKAAVAAKEKGVKIYTIGIGSLDGAPIPDAGGGFKKDAQGNLVISKPNETTLAKVAEITGGLFVRSVAGGMDLERIYNEGIRKQVAQRDFQATRQKLWFERFQWFLGLALLCLVAEFCLRDVRLAALLLAGVGFVASAPKASATPLEEAYNEAVQKYRKGDFQGAVGGFSVAGEATDQALAERSLFNLGNTQVQLGKLDEAIKAYENALALAPKDEEASDNLAYVKKLKEQQQQNQDQQKKSDDHKNDDKKNQDQKQNQPSSGDQKNQAQQQQGQNSPSDPKDQKNQKQDGSSPKPGDDQQQKKPADQGQDQGQPGQQPPAPQDQGGQSPKPQDQQREPNKEPGRASPQDQQASGKEGEAPKQEAGEGPQPVEARAQPMSPEDAEKLLRAVDDNPKRYLYAPKSNNPPRHKDKDW